MSEDVTAQIIEAVDELDTLVRRIDELLNLQANTYKSAGVNSWALVVDERAFTFDGDMTDEVFVLSPEGQPMRVTEGLLRYGQAQQAHYIAAELAAQFTHMYEDEEGEG